MVRSPAAKRSFLRSREARNALAVNVVLIVICLVMLLPIATTVLFTFEREQDITRNPPVLFPCDTRTAAFEISACRWSLDGYQRVILPVESKTSPLGFALAGRLFSIYLPNTLLYATATSVIVMVLSSMSGFALARYRFRGRDLMLTVILALSGLPWMTDVLALYQLGVTFHNALPVYDDRVYLIVVYTGFFLPLSLWITKGFFEAIPRELEEAALVDGCSPAGAFARITLPLATPGLAAIFLLTFVSVWNEFIANYLLINKNSYKSAMFGLYDYVTQNLANPQVVAAACVVIALPMVLVFLVARKTFFQAMVEGAIKG